MAARDNPTATRTRGIRPAIAGPSKTNFYALRRLARYFYAVGFFSRFFPYEFSPRNRVFNSIATRTTRRFTRGRPVEYLISSERARPYY
jgi:hypothetical protein